MASESVVLDALGYQERPSRVKIYIEMSGRVHRKQCCSSPKYAPWPLSLFTCQPDSMIDGISVYKARLKMGEKLAIRFSDSILTMTSM